MLTKLLGFVAAASAIELNEILRTDDLSLDAHEIWDSYMEKEEDVYDWFEYKNSSRKSVNGGTIHYLNVTSQTWLDESMATGHNGNIWSHKVVVVVPKNLKYTNFSLAYATGWCNGGDDGKDTDYLPEPTDEDVFVADEFAHQSQMIAITVFQIPNCPIIYPSDPSKKHRTEDSVLAWAWREFHETGGTNYEWLPRMPMAKAVF